MNMVNILETKNNLGMRNIRNFLFLMRLTKGWEFSLNTLINVIRTQTSKRSWRLYLMKRKKNNFSNFPKRELRYLITPEEETETSKLQKQIKIMQGELA